MPKAKKAAKASAAARHYARAGRFASYDSASGTYEAVPSVRPGNQNAAKVVRKTAALIRANVPRSQQRETTRAFVDGEAAGEGLSEMNAGVGLHMAHGRSADELKQTMVAVMNASGSSNAKTRALAVRAFEEFASGWISSDAEDADTIAKSAEMLTSPHAKPALKLKVNDKLLNRFNRVSRNLVGGDPPTNSGLGSAQDLATQRNGQVIRHMLRRSQVLDKLQKAMGVKPERIVTDAHGSAVTSTLDYA